MRFLALFALFALLLVASCADEGRYPVSGEECGPNDPVLSLDAADCTVPAMG